MASHVVQLLLAQKWDDIRRIFQHRQPKCAEEYSVRALLNLYLGDGLPDWPSVIGDFRQASELSTTDPLPSCNLTQALLDSLQQDMAFQNAEQTLKLHPNFLPAIEKHVLSSIATQRWSPAYRSLIRAKSLMGSKHQMPEWGKNLLRELSSQWWIPLELGGVVLRCPDASDGYFLKKTFSDSEFMRHYHRFQGASDQEIEFLICGAGLSPRETGRLDWIILDRHNVRVGVVALVDIDWRHERAEILIGIPEARMPTIALKASVAAITFAFERLGLKKLLSYIYADNHEAQDNTLHLGFVKEGLLRSHINSAGSRFDLHVNSLLPSDLADNSLIKVLSRRWENKMIQNAETQPTEVASCSENSGLYVEESIDAVVTFNPLNAGSYHLGVKKLDLG